MAKEGRAKIRDLGERIDGAPVLDVERDDCCEHSIWSHELLGEIDGELAFGKCTVPDCNCPVGR